MKTTTRQPKRTPLLMFYGEVRTLVSICCGTEAAYQKAMQEASKRPVVEKEQPACA